MKRFLAISLSLAMVFALFGAMTVSVSAETETKGIIDYDSENPLAGITASGASFSLSGNSIKIARTKDRVGGNEFNSTAGKAVLRTQMQSYIVIPLSFSGKLAENSSVSVKFKTPNSSGSVYEAFGVKMVDGTMYMKTTGTYSTSERNNYQTISISGNTFFNVDNTAESITLTTANFLSTAEDSERVASVIMAMAQYKTSGDYPLRYIENVYYQVEESSDPTITMQSGAAMRIDGDTNGIRFTATVDKTAFDELVGDATVNEIGTLIAKAGTDIGKVVVENAVAVTDSTTALEEGKIPVAKYAAGTTMQDVAGTDKYVIVGSLVEIKDANANQQYVARAYIKYTDSTGSHVLYASALSEARSISQVAKAIVDANDSYYTSLCKDHKDVVDYWAAQYAAA